ncbi:hypothetical protein D910_12812 [Dendroctonus ponderosae]
MLSEVSKEIKYYLKHCQILKRILRETNSSLNDINNLLQLGTDIKRELSIYDELEALSQKVERTPNLIIFGQSCHAKAVLVNMLLQQKILPYFSSQWRHVIPPDCHRDQLVEVLERIGEKVLPVIIYALSEDTLSDFNIQEIRKLKDIYLVPFLFVSVNKIELPALNTESLTEPKKHSLESNGEENVNQLHSLKEQLTRLGYISNDSDSDLSVTSEQTDELLRKKPFCLECSLDNALMSDKTINEDFILFIREILRSSKLKMALSLSELHNSCLRKFILCAFDMAREIQITPKRILYAQDVEMKMFTSLMTIASEQQEEITSIIQRTLQDMKSNVAEVLEGYNSSALVSPKVATMEIQQLVLKTLAASVAIQIVQSVGCLQESFTGTLERCLENLEKSCRELEGNLSASDAVKQIIHAAYNIDLKTPTSFSIVHTFMDRLRKLLGSFSSPWSSTGQFNCTLQWQLQVVTNMIDSLSASKLAKTISAQVSKSLLLLPPCAFKSVVPPDDKHWNDLAMEFYYTRTIPEHPRIVKLRGSVIDYKYGGGSSPAVLLLMNRMTKDLYCGLKSGLTWLKRLRIAIDVIEGIRYLHSQGLVHRDIKLKNVLLDDEDRAKLTDFGFCIPEAMMSGSIVGTPVHMAPELLSGRYDSSVDVYAFGILFWYICAGQVKLPSQFDQFQNKEQLWNSVRKGIRPECLTHFNEACWNLMEQCWSAEPSERPLLGNVQPQLEQIYKSIRNRKRN